MITVTKIDEVWAKLAIEERCVIMEVSDYFSFFTPTARWSPLFKNKIWDGKIRLFNAQTGKLYTGLIHHLYAFAKEHDYPITFKGFSKPDPISTDDFIKNLQLQKTPYDFQLDALNHVANKHRAVLVSPTGTGKSLIIYLIVKLFKLKTLIIVPSVQLVSQMTKDFIDYDPSIGKDIHQIYSGQEKETDKSITISTYQSLLRLPKEYFQDFQAVVCDEAHGADAKSIKKILENLEGAYIRVGTTGTLKDIEKGNVHQLVLEGLMGPIKVVTKTRDAIDNNILSKLNINILLLEYPAKDRKLVQDMDYQEEMTYILQHQQRNKFIKNLALQLQGNTLLLFTRIEHGKIIYDLLKEHTDRKVFYIDGGIDVDPREEIRAYMEKNKDVILVASYGTFSQGINIKNLHNVIFASFYKSRVKVLQSIGRVLRKYQDKVATLYDIADDLGTPKRKNFSLKHLIERIKMYAEEKHNYNIKKIRVPDNE